MKIDQRQIDPVLEHIEMKGKRIKDDALESFHLRSPRDPETPVAARYGQIGEEIERMAADLRKFIERDSGSAPRPSAAGGGLPVLRASYSESLDSEWRGKNSDVIARARRIAEQFEICLTGLPLARFEFVETHVFLRIKMSLWVRDAHDPDHRLIEVSCAESLAWYVFQDDDESRVAAVACSAVRRLLQTLTAHEASECLRFGGAQVQNPHALDGQRIDLPSEHWQRREKST